jgi:gliding motility-associated-like protein
MKKSPVSVAAAFFMASSLWGQTNYINAGNDTVVCAGSVTLTATVTDIPQSTAYTISNIPYNPFSFTTGTVLPVPVDDQYSGIIPIGFTFCYYGNPYTQLLISTNNYLHFNTANANQYSPWPINSAIPNPANPVNSIMGPWHDVDPSVGGIIRYQTTGTAPFRRFIVSFSNVPNFSCNNLLYTGQFVLYETTNIIETYIASKPTCATWNAGAAIHGLHDPTGANAAVVPGRNYPTNWTATNDGIRFSPSGPPTPYNIVWTNLSTSTQVGTGSTVSVSPNQNTQYSATVTFGCSNASFTDTVQVSIGIPGLTLASTNILCNGQTNGTASINVTGPGPYTYTWSTGATTSSVSNLGAGSYTVTVSDGSCTFTDVVVITEPTALVSPAASSTDTCGNGVGTASVNASGGTGPYTYQWSGGGQTTATATGLNSGTYTVTVTDQNGCTISATTLVGNLPGPTAILSANPSGTGTNQPVIFSDASTGGGGNIVAWYWNFGTSTFVGQNPPPQSYPNQGTFCATLTVVSSLGCIDSSEQCVLIADSVIIPNVFTPNGDGTNDLFIIQNLEAYPGSRLVIFNRWGNKVFESTDYKNNWNGGSLSDGTYYYVLAVADKEATVRRGYLSILGSKK